MPTYVALRSAVISLSDDGATERLTDEDVECVAAHPKRPDRVFVGTFESGLQRSTDAGAEFRRIGESIDSDAVTAVAVHPDDPDEVWVGTEPSAVYRSTDGGASFDRVEGLLDVPSRSEWSFPPRPDTHHVRWLEVDPHDPDRVYVAVEAGALVVTPDRGETWLDRPEGSRRDNHSLATHADAPGRVYSAAGDGYAESDDYGASWHHPQSGLDHRYVWSVAVDPGAPDTVFVSAASGAGDAHGHGGVDQAESYVYRRRGDGDWTRVGGDGLPTGGGVLRAVLASGTDAGDLYALTNHGLYRTRDAGDSWDRLGLRWPARYERQSPRGLVVTD
ncbi:MAG: WD40/YVTN/BNR-like repeat-containing protein [Halobacteriaceae archaeon]